MSGAFHATKDGKVILVSKIQRVSKSQYYLEIAKSVSARSTCMRRQYGAVIVKNDEIVATGYNGAPRGETNCCDAGACYRQRMGIPHGEQYEKCVAVHAEQNAIISASRNEMLGATLYLYGYDRMAQEELRGEPCLMCRRMIKNAGIEKVINVSGEISLPIDAEMTHNEFLKENCCE